MLNKKSMFLLALIPAISMATTTPAFDPSSPPTLGMILNTAKANQCTRILRACQNPKQGPLPNDTCVQTKIKINPSCEQMQMLANKLATSPALLKVSALPNSFSLVTKNYPADGQLQYYIVSPIGQLVDTRMDPRIYSTALKIQYPNNDLIVSNIDPVQYKTTKPNKPMTFTTTVKVSDGCMACTILGYATTRFIFKKDGSLQSIRLISFSKQENMRLSAHG